MPTIRYRYSKAFKPLAQELRRDMTPQERRLWYAFLCKLPERFRRQKQFGHYIVDFYCSSARLVLELDGIQHKTEEAVEYDRERDAYLRGLGLRVVRISNQDVDERFQEVCAYLRRIVAAGTVQEDKTAW